MNSKRKLTTQNLVLGAVMTALVVVFQLIGTYTTFFGPFSTALALIPIVIGAVMCGAGIGAWLGLVFSLVVLFTGGANLFFMFDIAGTLITVLVKGTLCGLVAGLVYKLFKKFNYYLAVFAASIVCPITNTAIFMLGSIVFFLDDAARIAETIGSDATGISLFVGMALANFLFELVMIVVLCPVIVRLLNIKKK